MSHDELSPLMKQYNELKAQAGDALLFFRMGDFYELFGDDAVEAARLLEITLTSRDKNKPNPMPMAGVPHHAYVGYLTRLLKAGKKVAVAEQMTDGPGETEAPRSSGKSIVRREIVRVFTPAVQFEQEGSEASYLALALPKEDHWVLACLDPATGEALVGNPATLADLQLEMGALPIKHLLCLDPHVPSEARATLEATASVLVEDLPRNYLSSEQAETLLRKQYGIENLEPFFPHSECAHALGILIQYALRTQKQDTLAHLRLPSPIRRSNSMVLGPRTAQHLDLLPSSDGTPNLFALINRTRSALGARQLRRWLLEPLSQITEIEARQTSVRELFERDSVNDRLGAHLSGLYDLERICGRVNARLANPRDTRVLGQSLALVPSLLELIRSCQSPGLGAIREALTQSHAALGTMSDRILRTQREDAPLSVRDGGIFETGTDAELDRLLSLTEDGQRWLVELEARERAATGIPSLKVKYNRVFGYYLEVTQAHLKNVPSHYQRKQTTVGAERFFTEELKKFEDEILTASSKQKALEIQLFEALVEDIRSKSVEIMSLARALGELDCLVSLARIAQEPGWVFPWIDDSRTMEIQSGRHPLVDLNDRGSFVPNDLELSPETRLSLLITGPNMGGKSTVMRQNALIVILGQMGAPVPARSARWGAVSSLYTRIGAHDAISRGQSTFMVEMSELAHILHHADDRSFIVLDEIGRGTSTYDGMSVAWATLEWICTQVQARTLFATHYHELTRLEGIMPGLANAHMAVEGAKSLARGSLRFLYKLKPGATNESFGVHVARIAGLPGPVIDRAWQVLEELEASGDSKHSLRALDSGQLSLFGLVNESDDATDAAAYDSARVETSVPPPEPHPMVRELETLQLDGMTPIQALNFLAKLQETARSPIEGRA